MSTREELKTRLNARKSGQRTGSTREELKARLDDRLTTKRETAKSGQQIREEQSFAVSDSGFAKTMQAGNLIAQHTGFSPALPYGAQMQMRNAALKKHYEEVVKPKQVQAQANLDRLVRSENQIAEREIKNEISAMQNAHPEWHKDTLYLAAFGGEDFADAGVFDIETWDVYKNLPDTYDGIKDNVITKEKVAEWRAQGYSDKDIADHLRLYAENAADFQNTESDALINKHLTQKEKYTFLRLWEEKGRDAAEEYLNSLRDTAAAREGAQIYSDLDSGFDKRLYQYKYGLKKGLQGFEAMGYASDLKSSVTADDAASGLIYEDSLNEDGSKSFTTYLDMGLQSAGSMTPSMVVGAIPGVGTVARALTTIGTAGGSATIEARRQGKEYNEALQYGLLSGTAEAGLDYLLGGIGKGVSGAVSKLGGEALENTAKAFVNASPKVAQLFKWAGTFGGKMGGEFLEEYSQEILDPVFRNIVFDENNEVKLFSSEALEAGLLGAVMAAVFDGFGIGSAIDVRNDSAVDAQITRELLKKGLSDAEIDKAIAEFRNIVPYNTMSDSAVKEMFADPAEQTRKAFSSSGQAAFDIAMEGATDPEATARQFEIKYREGELGYAFEVDEDSELTPSMQEAAYKYGAEAKASLGTVTYNTRAKVSGSLAKSFEKAAKDLNVHITYGGKAPVVNGVQDRAYITSAGELRIYEDVEVRLADGRVLKGDDAATMVILGHEMTHRLQTLDGKSYSAFREFVLARKSGAIEGYMKMGLSRDVAADEVVADYAMTTLFADQKTINEVTKKHSKLAEKIRDILEWIKTKLGIQSSELDRAIRLWNNAYNASVRNAKSGTQTKNTADSGVKYSSGLKSFTKNKYFDRKMDKWDALTDAYVNVGRIHEGNPLHLVGIKTGPVYYDVSKIKEEMASHSDHLTAVILKGIPDLLSDPLVIAEYKPGENKKTVNVYGHLYTESGSPVVVGVMVKKGRSEGITVTKITTSHAEGHSMDKINDTSVLYLKNNKKEIDAWFQARGNDVPLGGTQLGVIRSIDFNYSISDPEEKVKKKSVSGTEDILYSSSVDSNGDTLTEQQAEYFAGSKVRDKDGNLLVVYHGTPNKNVNVFSYDYVGSVGGSLYGYGFYFSDQKNEATLYAQGAGEIKACYLNITSPIYAMSTDLIDRLDELFERLPMYAKNSLEMEFGGIDSAKSYYKEYIGKHKNGIFMSTFASEATLHPEVFNRILGDMGYDGIIYKEDGYNNEYVVFKSDQSKLTSNKTPTSNPDIRHSTTGTEDILYADLENTKATPYKRTTESYREELDALNEEIRSINLFEGDALANMQRRNKLIAKAKRIESIIKKRLAPKIESNDAIDSDAFISWFGNWRNGTSRSSKVVDEEGKPLIVYHGTGTTIEEFLPEFTGQGTDQYGSGFYFTTDISTANGYTTRTLNEQAKLGGTDNPNVIPAYLNIRRPLVIDATKTANLYSIDVSSSAAARIISKMPDIMDEENSILGDYFEEYWNGGPRKYMITQLAEEYDWTLGTLATDIFRDYPTEFRQAVKDVLGYDGIQVNFASGEKHFIAWFPNQIKHATENNGAFSKKDNRIKYSTAGTEDILFESEAEKAQYVADSFDLSGAENFKAAGSMERMSNIANSIAKAHRVNKDGRTKLAKALEKGVHNMRKAAKSDDAKVKQTAAEGFLEAAMVISPDADVQAQVEIANALAESVWAEMTTDRLPDTIRSIRDDAIKAARAEVRADRLAALGEKYGTIKPGERLSRVVTLPKKTSEGKKVSQTVRTVMEAEATPDEMIPTIEQMVADGEFSYETITDKGAVAKAEDRITKNGFDATVREWFKSVGSGKVSKDNTALGWTIYNNAANSGDSDLAIEVLCEMVKHQRNAAQALQATRILKKLSPSGQLYAAQKSVQGLQEELIERYGDKAPELKIDPKLAEEVLNADTEEKREEALADLYRDVGRQMPSSVMDKWNAWRYLSMLGNARTHIRNIVGNAGFAPVVAAKNITATGIESLVSFASRGKIGRTKAFVGVGKADRALLAAAWTDYDAVADAALGQSKYNDNQFANKHIEEGKRVFKFKPLEAARRGNSWLLDKEDSWFSKPQYANALAQYCKANGITAEQIKSGKDLEKARAYAIKEAQKATYRDTNAFSELFSKLGRINERGEFKTAKRIWNRGVEGVLPFRKTPANILARGIEYSPIGLGVGVKNLLLDVKSGKVTAAEAIDKMSAGLTGSGLMALGAFLVTQGLLRGFGGDDDKEKEYMELMGHQQYALEIGNTSVTLDWLAPEALPFFVGANIAEQAMQDGEMTVEGLISALGSISDPMLSMSCLQGLNDLIESVSFSDTSGIVTIAASAATSYLTQGIPTLFGQIERTSEAERMMTYTSKGNKMLTPDMQYTVGKVSAKLPGDYSQIPYIDAWGRTESSGSVGERAFNNMLNPSYTSTVSESPMEKELLRLYNQTGESVLPSRADKSFPIDGEQVYLTAEQYQKYATSKGKRSHRILTALTNSDTYNSLDDFTKAEIVSKVYSYCNAIAKSGCGAKNNAGKGYALDGWVSKAYDACSKYGIDEATYIAAYIMAGNAGKYVNDGETIDNSPGLCIMQAVYSIPGLSQEQYDAMFVNFGVGSKVRGYDKKTVESKIAEFNKKYERIEG